MNKNVRNIIIFGLVSFGCGFAGNAINDLVGASEPMESLGVLIWLVSPLLANLLLRAFGGDGWKDLGIGLKLKTGWRWYLAALIIPTLFSLILFMFSWLTGSADLHGFFASGLAAFAGLLISNFMGSMVKNIFEEFAWRGYLASRLENLGSRPFFNSLITGLIWVSWHIPYYLFFLNRADLERQTTLSIPALILLGYILMSCQSLLYNELRLISGSVWPAWLLHTAANAFSFALVTGGFVAVSGKLTHLIFTPGTEGILYSILAGLVGWALHRRRMKTA